MAPVVPNAECRDEDRRHEDRVLHRVPGAPGAGAAQPEGDLERQCRADVEGQRQDHQGGGERREAPGVPHHRRERHEGERTALDGPAPGQAASDRPRQRRALADRGRRHVARHERRAAQRHRQGAQRDHGQRDGEVAVVLGPERPRDDRGEEDERDHLGRLAGEARSHRGPEPRRRRRRNCRRGRVTACGGRGPDQHRTSVAPSRSGHPAGSSHDEPSIDRRRRPRAEATSRRRTRRSSTARTRYPAPATRDSTSSSCSLSTSGSTTRWSTARAPNTGHQTNRLITLNARTPPT